ncbi:MAG TPA: CHAT domain-containing protein, partial [Polyangiaceae bacterium]
GGAPKSESLLNSLDFQVDLALSVAQRAPDNADAVKLAFVLMSVRKAKRLELERRTSAGLRDAPLANAGKLRAAWLAQRSAIAALEFQRAMGVKPSDADRSKLEELRAAESKLQLQIVGSAKASRIADAGTDLDAFPTQLQALLAPGESEVSYVRYQAGVPGQKAGTPQTGPRYAAFVVNGQGLSFFDLGEATKIDKTVEAYLTELDTLDSCPAALAAKKALASTLYQAVFAPLSGKLSPKSAVRVVPDASLALVPFAALHDGSDWLLSRFQFSYQSSERELLGEYLPPRTPAPPLVLGWTPPNDNPPAHVAGQPLSPNDLPAIAGVTLEAQAVSQILPQSRLLSGASASENSLFRAASPSILHIAAHGVFVGSSAAEGGARGLVLVPSTTPKDCSKKRVAPAPAAASAADPNAPDALVRSALVLAPSGPSSGDGFLTAYEVSTLDLWSTELAVLSACETGRGGLGRTEGVRGMRAAFSAAGARSLVVSLWHVPDSPTMNLMKAFYARLVQRKGRREALQQAMLEAQKLDPDPSSWAAFILLGDTGPLVALGGVPAQASGLQVLPTESEDARQIRAVNFLNMEHGRAANPSTTAHWTFRGASDRQLAGDVRTELGPAQNNARFNLLG